ncbi:ubiquitin carboxyl-terminal hydrolase 5 isoform X1 [Polyodon spathula]|uniref:ubiquitin carboxyl-terminal hydrolase 5 isoform X1 n=1 Tax=Polyodon spathula TaxID=7913 RepID=UPI001B7EBC73|nr:ubiquitin carboxyl-terminal hydrolase 5 isoform X1 [Polyodon spathula]
MADLNEVLLSVLSTIRVPKPGDRVHKDECAFSFDSPESEGGLYVCMSTFLGFGKQFVERHYRKSGQRAYLHIKRTRKPKEEEGGSGSGDPPRKKPTRLAIGVEGGFEVSSEHAQFEEEVKLVILPERLEVTSEDLSSMPDVVRERVSLSLSGILSSDSASHQDEVQQWDGEVRLVSKHAAGLQQLDSGLRIPPSGWRCQVCDLDENLWMNLTDGAILCGRRYFDGSGGNNHAMQHYRETGFPLAVKLGTITPAGADVYSYDEDDMVLDPGLPSHLAHFGIDMMQMQKTDKTMTELEIDMNQRIGEWEVIQESGGALQPLCGPGYTGMKNLGNSCYLNSVMQVLFSVPDFQSTYVANLEKIYQDAPTDPTQDFRTQVAKLGHGLLSGEYCRPAEGWSEGGPSTEPKGDQEGIAPRMFKALVGKGHPEFSTNRQQDAQEFLLHFVNMVERYCRSSDCPSESFRFLVEERIHCLQSDKVKYTQRAESLLQLPVPLEHATNKEELSEYEQKKKEAELAKAPPPELVRAHIPFAACLSALSEPETLEEFWSSALQAKSMASKTTRFASFPDYLVIQIKKFTFGLDWVPKKLDVSIEMPDSLDVSSLRGAGLQPGEEELPDLAPPSLITPDVEVKGSLGGFLSNTEEDDSLCSPLLSTPNSPVLDESVITQLAEMGFPVEACRKAVFYTGNTGVEAAMNWVMTHMDDPDFSAPLVLPGFSPAPTDMPTPQGTPDPPPSEEHLATIISMGFSRDQASRALKATSNSLERAVDWIFSHIDDLDAMDISEGRSAAESVSESVPAGPRVRDGEGKYELFAFISHMGTSTMCGHYVCHIKKEGRWVIYNDQKVCASEKPPKDLGYIYFYQRSSS